MDMAAVKRLGSLYSTCSALMGPTPKESLLQRSASPIYFDLVLGWYKIKGIWGSGQKQ
jgi:hypothetical protein